jgi:hypothetical protein
MHATNCASPDRAACVRALTVVAESVNVKVLLYVPVRSASPVPRRSAPGSELAGRIVTLVAPPPRSSAAS